MSDSETVNHPAHYNGHPSGVECIDLAERLGFNLGNALKYIWRAGLKGDAGEDYQKALWYFAREQSFWAHRIRPAPSLDETMLSLFARVIACEEDPVKRRCFADLMRWACADEGGGAYLQRHVRRLSIESEFDVPPGEPTDGGP